MSEDLRSSAGSFAPGSRVGRYAIEEQIGHGGMAAVFRARDEQLGRIVALKILAPTLAADQAFRQRFIRESRAAAAVEDPHIIPLYEAGDADGALFIAMRYVPGGDVRTLIYRQGPLPADRVVAIVSPVASALDAAHATGLVHRDVKPANMLLDARTGRPDHVYLSDFGLSKDTTGMTSLTGTGQFLGTVDYAAPEQIQGRQVDGRADQYALACAAFEMLCGEPPFCRDHGLAVLAAHISQQPPLLSAMRDGLPAAVDAVFARALAKRAEDRYPTCGDFSDALRDALGLGRYHARPPETSHTRTELGTLGSGFDRQETDYRPQPVPSRRDATRRGRRPASRWPLAIAAIVVAAALVTVAVIIATRFTPSRSAPGTTPPARTPSQKTTPPGSWTPYRHRGLFTIDLPPDRTPISTGSDEVKFAISPPGFVVVVAWTRTPKLDALTDWRQQSAAKAAADASYQRISIRRVNYRGYNSADWEFTERVQGELDQFVDRGFIVHQGTLGFAIELYGPQARFESVYSSIWHELVSSFQPAS